MIHDGLRRLLSRREERLLDALLLSLQLFAPTLALDVQLWPVQLLQTLILILFYLVRGMHALRVLGAPVEKFLPVSEPGGALQIGVGNEARVFVLEPRFLLQRHGCGLMS